MRAASEAAALLPLLHGPLASGLVHSFFDVFGSVEPLEARELFRKITVRDEQVRAALERVLDEKDPRWTKWLHAGRPEAASYLALLEAEGPLGPWVYGSQLIHEGRELGRLVHWAFPFDPEISHQTFSAGLRKDASANPANRVLFRVHGSPGIARDALGAAVESWPPGLFEP